MKPLLMFFIIQRLLLMESIPIAAQERWTFESLGGGAYCLKTPLTIQQSGSEEIELTAKYATHSLASPIYYALRLAAWKDTQAWELELIHLKLELINTPADIQHFEISHGYNLLFVNRAWTKKSIILRLGAGIVIAHPENTVREQTLNEHRGILHAGYDVTGPTVQAAVGKRWSVNRHLFFTIEGKFTGSYASVSVADGQATVPNVALHGLFGLGYQF